MDDLSFEESELEYKYLKAILEGGFGRRPENVLIYATSNRRHLIRESFRDKTETDEELQPLFAAVTSYFPNIKIGYDKLF